MYLSTYSRVLNKRTGRLLENEKKSHLYTLIRNYTFINFQKKVPSIRLFPPIILLFLYFCPIILPFKNSLWPILKSDDLWSYFEATIGKIILQLLNSWSNSKQTLLYLYWMLPKNPTYTFIQTYTFISFQQKFPPICLFPPILLLVFEEISHLYFYSEPSSIRSSRVVYSTLLLGT